MRTAFRFAAGLAVAGLLSAGAAAEDNVPPPGFTPLFNGKDLTGWKGHTTPTERKLAPEKVVDLPVTQASPPATRPSGVVSPEDKDLFAPLVKSLLTEDRYMVLEDFAAYAEAHQRVEDTYLQPDTPANPAIATFDGSSNGIAEYTATNFAGALDGDILVANWNGLVYDVKIDPSTGRAAGNQVLFSGVGTNPISIATQSDGQPFRGVIFVLDPGS